VRELECLLELRPRARAVAQIQECLAQTHAGERLAPNRTQLAAQPRRVEQMCAGGLQIAGEQLSLAEHGGGERLAPASPYLLGLGTQTLGKARETLVRIARREHVLGHAQVGVENTTRKPR